MPLQDSAAHHAIHIALMMLETNCPSSDIALPNLTPQFIAFCWCQLLNAVGQKMPSWTINCEINLCVEVVHDGKNQGR